MAIGLLIYFYISGQGKASKYSRIQSQNSGPIPPSEEEIRYQKELAEATAELFSYGVEQAYYGKDGNA